MAAIALMALSYALGEQIAYSDEIPLVIGVTRITCEEETDEVGADEPYIVTLAVLVHRVLRVRIETLSACHFTGYDVPRHHSTKSRNSIMRTRESPFVAIPVGNDKSLVRT